VPFSDLPNGERMVGGMSVVSQSWAEQVKSVMKERGEIFGTTREVTLRPAFICSEGTSPTYTVFEPKSADRGS
jgi:hypothetical protein